MHTGIADRRRDEVRKIMLASVSMLIGLGLSFTRGMDGRTLRARRGRARKICLAEISIEIARLVLSMTGHTKRAKVFGLHEVRFHNCALGTRAKGIAGKGLVQRAIRAKGVTRKVQVQRATDESRSFKGSRARGITRKGLGRIALAMLLAVASSWNGAASSGRLTHRPAELLAVQFSFVEGRDLRGITKGRRRKQTRNIVTLLLVAARKWFRTGAWPRNL